MCASKIICIDLLTSIHALLHLCNFFPQGILPAGHSLYLVVLKRRIPHSASIYQELGDVFVIFR